MADQTEVESLRAQLRAAEGDVAEVQAAREWVAKKTGVGGGTAPLSFLIASHEQMARERTAAEEAKERAERERDEARAELASAQMQITAVVHTVGGIVEGLPTGTHNYLQRIRQLLVAEAARWKCSLCGVSGPKTLEAMNEHLLSCEKRPATAAEGALSEAREEGEHLRKRVAALEKQLAGERDQLRRERHQHREHGKIIDRALESEEIECRRLLRSLNDIGLPPPETP